ncbi:MAG TPA: hypothetical protein PLE45_05845 [Spirochaetota bacterium]|nr:hypothetical protein [Spirochaetota bacterium]HOL56418.1 hypothetical protein [Spirochaetota bacterium]HPP03409.1 hypothetical protein [Spirochaetota bacterium]
MLDIEDLKNERFEIKLEDKEKHIFKFYGMIDIKDSFGVLDPYFHQIHNEVVKNNIKEIKLDFTELQFLNSSGIKSFINLISLIKSLPQEKQYIINAELNKSYSWQQDCFKVLSVLGQHIMKF